MMYANGGGPGSGSPQIQAPDGTIILDSTTGPSDSLVQFSCDGVLGPKFPELGGEVDLYNLAATETCPGLDQQFRTVDRRLYKIFCGAYLTPGAVIRNDKRSFSDCLKACTAEPNCNEIDFTADAPLSTAMGMCWIKGFSESGPVIMNPGPVAISAVSWPPK